MLILILLGCTEMVRSQHRVIIAGGAATPDALKALRASVPLDSVTTILLTTVDGHDASDMLRGVDAYATLVRGTGARVVVVSGGKWAEDAAEHIKSLKEDNVIFYPEDGCPGPETIDIGDGAKLVVLNTDWWLRDAGRPGIESDCPCKTEQQVLDKVDDLISDHRDKLVLVAGYHPFRSTGIHSGYFGPRQHIFPLTDIRGMRNAYLPLPVAGTLYPIVRNVLPARADAAHERYQQMVSSFDAVLGKHSAVVQIAGYEHVLELYEDEGRHYINSNALAGAGRAVRTRHTPFVSRKAGFAVLEISADKKATATFYTISGGQSTIAYQKLLVDYGQRPPMERAAQSVPVATSGDSVLAPVYAPHGTPSRLKRFAVGNNYRAEWSEPVMLPRFHLAEDPRGFKISGQGGGNQTTTIRLKDSDGHTWSLRSIVKDPEKVLPENLRRTIAADVMHDLMSASHPFGPAVANELSAAAGVVRPQLAYYYVPDDTALGYYRPAFANTIAALEEQQPSRYGEDTKSTGKVFNGHIEKWRNPVDQRSFLRARLLDMLVADFDRHYEQWKWGATPGDDSAAVFYAIPKDHDQALYHSDGLVTKLAAGQGMSYLSGLQEDIANVRSLGLVSRDIDAFFLNELTAADWRGEIDTITRALTDARIHEAVASMPAAAYKAHGPWIEERLKARRDALAQRGMEYYRFLARQVSIVGSNKAEVFTMKGAPDGLRLTVRKPDESGAVGRLLYERTFHAGETKEIRLYGLGGKDRFTQSPDVPSKVRVRVVGGSGRDTFDLQGGGRTLVYDEADAGNVLMPGSRAVNMISHRSDVNQYRFRENNYNSFSYPVINLGYNIDDGFIIGAGLLRTVRGFRGAPYTSQQRLSALYAVEHNAVQMRYAGVFNSAWKHNDVLVNAVVQAPSIHNFFGLGNETVRDPALPVSYYRTRYGWANAEVLLRRRFWGNKMSIAAGPSVTGYWNNRDRDAGRMLSDYPVSGLDSVDVFATKWYGGARLSVDFNSIDNALLPTRGMLFNAQLLAQAGMSTDAASICRGSTDLTVYAPLSNNKRFIIVLRGGGGHVFSSGFEYWQAMTLGQNNGLRGYRKDRFAGSSSAYGSAELRWRVARFKARLLPGELGLIGFEDAGRVWMDGQSSDVWHRATGGGIYFTPFNAVLITVTAAFSDEEQLVNGSIGMGLNVSF